MRNTFRSFVEPCKFVMQRLRCQIMQWSGYDDCGQRGNKCLYLLKEEKLGENNTIRATHLSQNLQLIDDIKIVFDEAQNHRCVAKMMMRSSDADTILGEYASIGNKNCKALFSATMIFPRKRREVLATSKKSVATSVSRSRFRMFDYGTNYCNLRNLVEGAGFDMDPKFQELTNDTVCTQRTTAVCV